MRGPTKAYLVAAGLAIGVGGLATYNLNRPAELPQPSQGAHRDVFPDLDLRAAAPGTSLERVYRGFGKQPPHRAASGRRCIYFAYDPELFSGALVVLANGTLVENSWVVEGDDRPGRCSNVPEERVDLRGWHAASVR